MRTLFSIPRLQRLARPLGAALEHVDAPTLRAPVFDTRAADNAPWPGIDYREPADPDATGDARHFVAAFLPAKPLLPVGCRVAVQYDAASGEARVALHPAARMPVRAGVEAHVTAAARDVNGDTRVQGWLAAYGWPVLPVSLLPTRWWSDARPAAQLMQDIWNYLPPSAPRASRDNAAPPPDDDAGFRPPSRLILGGVVHEDFVDVRVHGVWSLPDQGEAQVVQRLKVLPDGDTLAGAGSLAYRGDLPELSRFLDAQLLPFLGESPVTPAARAPSDLEPVLGAATWSPLQADGSGFDLHAQLVHPKWRMQGRFTTGDSRSRFAVDFSGHPATLATAVRDVRLPRACHIEDLASHVDASRVLARAWNPSRHAQTPCHAMLQLRGGHDPVTGLHGTADVHISRGPHVDVFSAGLAPKRPRLFCATPHVADEAGPLELGELPDLHPAFVGVHNVARFVAGQQASWDGDVLQAWGVAPMAQHLWVKARRYSETARAWLPVSTLQSIVGLWRHQGESVQPIQENPGFCLLSA